MLARGSDGLLSGHAAARGRYWRTRNLDDEHKQTKQPPNEALIPIWFAGRPDPGAAVVLCEGEPDALAAISALNGDPYAVAAIPGVTIPVERVTAELASADTVYLALDGDEEGRRAANDIARTLQHFTQVRVVRLGNGEDIASRLYREDDRRGWLLEALETAKVAPKVAPKRESGGYRRKAADRTRDLFARGIDPERIDPAALLDDIGEYITTYVVLPEPGDVIADLLSLWVFHTWAFDAWWATPYLRITSAAPDSAKTLLQEVLASVSRGGWHVVNPSTAVLFRKIARDRPTLFLDEMDNYPIDERRDALAVLDSGYKPGTPVPRCNERGDLEEFECYCPKAYAAIDVRQMPPALLSRSITIRMVPKHAGEPVDSYIAPDAGPRADVIRDSCAAWAERHGETLKGRRPDLVGLTNRRAEVWWPMLVLGEYVGGEWTARARRAARALGAGGDSTDRPAAAIQLLIDIAAAFGDDVTIATVELLRTLNALEESPWGAPSRGLVLNATTCASRPCAIRETSERLILRSSDSASWGR